MKATEAALPSFKEVFSLYKKFPYCCCHCLPTQHSQPKQYPWLVHHQHSEALFLPMPSTHPSLSQIRSWESAPGVQKMMQLLHPWPQATIFLQVLLNVWRWWDFWSQTTFKMEGEMLWSRLLKKKKRLLRSLVFSYINPPPVSSPSFTKHLCTDSGLLADGALTMQSLHDALPPILLPVGLWPPPLGLLVLATASWSPLLFILAAACFPVICPFSFVSHHFAQASCIPLRLVTLPQTPPVKKALLSCDQPVLQTQSQAVSLTTFCCRCSSSCVSSPPEVRIMLFFFLLLLTLSGSVLL